MMQNKKYVVVTGGAGYIGSHTVISLIESGYTPIIIDDFRNSHEDVIERVETITGKDVIYFPAACQNEERLDHIFSQFPVFGVIHFAADKGVGESVANPLKYFDNNVSGLITVLQKMVEYKINNFVFSSSCTVYGIPEKFPVTEDTPLSYNSPYGLTKLMGEQIIQEFVASHPEFKATVLRYFNPVGAHESGLIGEEPGGIPNNLLPFITQTAFGLRKELTVYGDDYDTPDGTCIRDYIHVQDLADAHVASIKYLERTEESITVLNVGTGKGTSVLELITAFEEEVGMKLPYRIGARREGDIPSIYADTEKANRLLNWSSKRTIREAVLSSWEFEKFIRAKRSVSEHVVLQD